MATYKDDLDILKAAEKADTNKLTFNAITELDNKGLLGRYGGGEEPGPYTTSAVVIENTLGSNFTAHFFIVNDGVLFSDNITVPHGGSNTASNVVNGTTIWFAVINGFVADITGDLELIPGPVAGDTHPAVLVNGNGTVTIRSSNQLA